MKNIAILGGGPAGLAVGYYAKKSGLPFTIYESKESPGGNCVTLRHEDFLFDSGAHRFHDKIDDITGEIRALLGEDLREIDAPSAIFREGRLLRFPLSPLDLLRKLGLLSCLRATGEIVRARLAPDGRPRNFAEHATRLYGKTIATSFLLNYTEKLWGRSCDRLSPTVAGERLSGLHLRGFFLESFFRRSGKPAHMEGTFLYPKKGIGVITQSLAESCGRQNIRTRSRISSVFHDCERIQKIGINGTDLLDVKEVVSTLPLDYFLHAMKPEPPRKILLAAENISYRDLLLVALFLNKPAITPHSTVYFPESHFLQTRIYEPRNRSFSMSPPGKTSLVAEIPCRKQDGVWSLEDRSLVRLVASPLIRSGWIAEKDVMDACVVRLDHAYPILEAGYEKYIQDIMNYLKGFRNLRLSGRNATFAYVWVHNILKSGQRIVRDYAERRCP